MRMASHGTEPLEDQVGAFPESKLGIHSRGEFGERREISVVKTEAPKQFPDSFDGIKLWAVGRQEVKVESRLMKAAPLCVQGGVMVFRVVGDNDHAAAGRGTDPMKVAEEVPARLGIKVSEGFRAAELAVADSNGPEVADGLAGRRMLADGIENFRWHPHPAAAAVLLEVNLIHRPQVDGGIFGQSPEFFCVRPAAADLQKQSEDGVCADETPSAGTTAGTAAREGLCPGAGAGTTKEGDHPKGERQDRSRTDCRATPSPRGCDRRRSIATDAQSALRRSSLQIHPSRTDAPSSRLPGANRPVLPPPADNSILGPPEVPRGAGGRSRLRSCAESRPEAQKPSLRGCQCSTPSWNVIITQSDTMRNYL